MKRITAELLKPLDPCPDGLRAFKRFFPKGTELSDADLKKASKLSYMVTGGFAKRLLHPTGRTQYDQVILSISGNPKFQTDSDAARKLRYLQAFRDVWAKQHPDKPKQSAIRPLTLKYLEDIEACAEGKQWFRQRYPNGFHFTPAEIKVINSSWELENFIRWAIITIFGEDVYLPVANYSQLELVKVFTREWKKKYAEPKKTSKKFVLTAAILQEENFPDHIVRGFKLDYPKGVTAATVDTLEGSLVACHLRCEYAPSYDYNTKAAFAAIEKKYATKTTNR